MQTVRPTLTANRDLSHIHSKTGSCESGRSTGLLQPQNQVPAAFSHFKESQCLCWKVIVLPGVLLLSVPPEQQQELPQTVLWVYLRKLSRRRGRGQRIGHHGPKDIQVTVLACACVSVVRRRGGRRVCNMKEDKLVLQVECGR